jgi:hypothetical protein
MSSSLYVYRKPLARDRDGFVKCRENPALTHGRRDTVSVHVGSKVWTDTPEHDADPAARQFV